MSRASDTPLVVGGAALGALLLAVAAASSPTGRRTARTLENEVETILTDWLPNGMRRTSAFEEQFGSVQRNLDGNGISDVILQWTQKSGALGRLLPTMANGDAAASPPTEWSELEVGSYAVRRVTASGVWHATTAPSDRPWSLYDLVVKRASDVFIDEELRDWIVAPSATSGGRAIEGTGLAPDIAVAHEDAASDDSIVDAALLALRVGYADRPGPDSGAEVPSAAVVEAGGSTWGYVAFMLLYVSFALAAPPTTHPALDALIADAKLHGTTSLYIVQDGVPLVDFQRGDDIPVRMMSVTKSVAALGVAKLHDSGQLPDVQAPLSTWLPDLPEPARSVPLDAVLTMTSGLDPCDDLSRCGNGGDAAAIAGALPRVAPVGTWAYTNTAVNLVSAVVAAVAGEPLDSFIDREVFRPLGIVDARWERDDRGLPYVAAGLSLTAHGLVRIGEMMLGDGQRDGVRVLHPGTVGWLTETGPSVPMYGRLWWAVPAGRLSQSGALLDYIRAVGGDAAAVDRLSPLIGRHWWDEMELRREQIAALGGGAAGESAWRGLAFHAPLWDADPTLYGYAAEGYCGQYLVVVPEAKLVAVRLRRIGTVFAERDQDPNDLPDWPMQVVRAALKDAGR